jgi:hypothetical protein
MATRISRYNKLPEEVVVDSDGRSLQSTSLRMLPEVSGIFEHTVRDGDRLDHLAFKYYKEPRKWWRICDANPLFLSPLALLGKEVIVTMRFPLTIAQGLQPPWSQLIELLQGSVGIEDVQFIEDVNLIAQQQMVEEEEITFYSEQIERSVVVEFNSLNISTEQVNALIASTAFEVGQPECIGRVGKKIIIPPNVTG